MLKCLTNNIKSTTYKTMLTAKDEAIMKKAQNKYPRKMVWARAARQGFWDGTQFIITLSCREI
jgi:hypothetical protein